MPSAEDCIERGNELLEQGDAEQALTWFTRATEIEPANAQAWYCQGTIHSSRGDYRNAIDCYAYSAKTAGDRAALPHYNMGNAYQELGELANALRCFELAIAADPEMADAWINRGRLQDDSGQHAAAIESYDTALGLAPDDALAWANRGNSLRALSRFQEALDSYNHARQYEPQNLAALIGTGSCLGQLGQPEKGLELIDYVLQHVNHPAGHLERSVLLGLLNRHGEALTAIDAAIGAGMSEPQAWNNRGEYLARLNRVPESLESFDRALAINASFAPAWFGKARVLSNQGRKAEAMAAIERYFATTTGADDLGEAAQAVVTLCRSA